MYIYKHIYISISLSLYIYIYIHLYTHVRMCVLYCIVSYRIVSYCIALHVPRAWPLRLQPAARCTAPVRCEAWAGNN